MQTFNEVQVFELVESSVNVVVVTVIKKEIIINPLPQKRIVFFSPSIPPLLPPPSIWLVAPKIPPQDRRRTCFAFLLFDFLVQFEFQVFPAPVEPLRSAFSPLLVY